MSSSKTTSSPISSPELFDHELREKRLCRYDPSSDFLGDISQNSLLDRISFIKRSFSDVLLVGQFKPDFVDALDAQNVTHLPFLAEEVGSSWGSYDLIVVNLNLHWVNDLPGVLWQIRHLLKPDGLFLGSLLGGDTLQELKDVFVKAEMELFGGISPRVVPMIDLYSASQLLLRADFKLPVADRDKVVASYESTIDLFRDLRKMGQTNVMHARHKAWSSRQLFERVEELYGDVSATYEIIYLTGWSFHESQQKALKPGSAVLRLEDYL